MLPYDTSAIANLAKSIDGLAPKRDLGVFREKAIERKLDEKVRERKNHETQVLTLLTFVLLMRCYMHPVIVEQVRREANP